MYDLDLGAGMKEKVWAVCYKSTANDDKFSATQDKTGGSEDSQSRIWGP